MKNKEQEIDYDAYFRKSSEADDKQVQSIDDQRREMREFAEKNHLKIVGEFEESQSAHTPGRPVFNEVVKRIQKGISNGLLVWHANRISRNPVDIGTIIHLIDEGKLIHVKTPAHIYGNDPTEKLMLALECMLAKKDSDDKSYAVKRGLRGRYRKGFPNGLAPTGHLNDLSGEKGDRKWLVDKEKLPLVRQLLELCLTGKYSTRALLDIANNEMGLRTPQHKKQGGRKLVLSHLTDTILKNPVYAGFFFTKDGERHELTESVPRVITEEEHEQILKIIGNRCRVRPSTNKMIFAYKEPTTCGGCSGSVTAEHKYQVICDCKLKFAYMNKTHCPGCGIAIKKLKKPTYLHYIFYHCTRKKDPTCKEGSVQELFIDDYLASYFKENFKISKALHDWCIENLEALDKVDAKDGSEKKISLDSTLAKKQKEYKELVLMKTRELISDGEFIELKTPLKREIDAIEQAISKNGNTDKATINKAHRAFTLALGIEEVFKNGTVQEKKDTLSEIGSNLTLKDKKLNVYNTGVYKKIIDGLLTAKKENSRFEPENIKDTSSRNSVFADVCPTLLRG
jgi:DNA invertase Pin-like site-specific DNA recombinase